MITLIFKTGGAEKRAGIPHIYVTTGHPPKIYFLFFFSERNRKSPLEYQNNNCSRQDPMMGAKLLFEWLS